MKEGMMPLPMAANRSPHVKATDYFPHYSHFLQGTSDVPKHILKDWWIWKCTVSVLSAKQVTIDNVYFRN
jgi:hypothetical protein